MELSKGTDCNDSTGADDKPSNERGTQSIHLAVECTQLRLWFLDNIALDFLDLTSPPLDNPDVFNFVVRDLLHSKIDVYFARELKYVALGPEGSVRESGESHEWSKSQARVFQWLHNKKAVQRIRQVWVSDSGCDGDSRITKALWDPENKRPIFSEIDVFSWLAPNISIKTVQAVAPTVKLLNLVWDGRTKVVLEAWETDLNNRKLQEVLKTHIPTPMTGY
jgi:hypothetical protein